MIHLVPSLTLERQFSAQDLPDALQLPLLNSIVIPRIVSSSMMPTIQQGDRLELSPPTSLTIGSIVVFRQDTMFVCHRIIAIDPHGILSTRGDATQGACEVIRPASVIGVVTAVLREGIHISLGQGPHILSALTPPTSFKSRIRAGIVRSAAQVLRVLARISCFQQILAILLRWTATVDVLAQAPLRSLPSHSKIASFPLRMSSHIEELLTASTRQQSTRYAVRLGPWQLAQYDPTTGSLLVRHSLRDAGLESLVRQLCGEHHSPSE